MAPLWWVTLYGLTIVVFMGVNWLNYYAGEGVPQLEGSGFVGGVLKITKSINWKW